MGLHGVEFLCRNSLAEWSWVFVKEGNSTYYETQRHRGHGGVKSREETKTDRGKANSRQITFPLSSLSTSPKQVEDRGLEPLTS